MDIDKLLVEFLCFMLIEAVVIRNENTIKVNEESNSVSDLDSKENIAQNLDDVFKGVYTECFLHLSYSCVQNKTLFYLKELNNLSEVSVIGDYVKFVKFNSSKPEYNVEDENTQEHNSDELAYMIDKAIDYFFDNHVIKFIGLGREISLSKNVDEFVGRKKRKGGGGGGHGGDDGGKKKMMMMAMMCMKMKLMMMVPAMMGMMGMMSFKGMMFSMMSFMVSKMMLLMKILEKKGGVGGLGAGGADAGWAAGGAGGGAWMPAGGQDLAGGGYDANGQWQSRSILEIEKNKPILTYVDPIVKYNYNIDTKQLHYDVKRLNEIKFDKPKVRNKRHLNYLKATDYTYLPKANYKQRIIEIHKDDKLRTKTDLVQSSKIDLKFNDKDKLKAVKVSGDFNEDAQSIEDCNDKKGRRKKRSIIDDIQNTYIYWVNKILGISNRRSNPKYKIINGMKYVYYPYRQKYKMPKEAGRAVDDGIKTVVAAEDFNKGEIIEGGVESRMNRKKFHKMKDTVNDTIDENPWE